MTGGSSGVEAAPVPRFDVNPRPQISGCLGIDEDIYVPIDRQTGTGDMDGILPI